MRTFTSPEELIAAVGEHLGYSDWHQIDQDRVNLFADATGDHQWIHVDAEKAAQGPFGTTIAHGYLMLSLFPDLMTEVYRVQGVRMGINYGLNKVRFPAVLPVGSKVRVGATLVSVDKTPDGGYQIAAEATLSREGGEKPCCVAQTLARLYF
jgi:acyl dehydratase